MTAITMSTETVIFKIAMKKITQRIGVCRLGLDPTSKSREYKTKLKTAA